MFKSCDFPSLTKPRSYACGNHRFTCAIGEDEDKEYQDGGDKLQQPNPRALDASAHLGSCRWAVLQPGMVAFPQSCVAESWHLANHQAWGPETANGKASLALYALQTAVSQREVD